MPANSLANLADYANAADDRLAWPSASWDLLGRAGGLRWCIPTTYGGLGLRGAPLLEKYLDLAAACLTTCFILSQRDAACRRLLDLGSEELRHELLPPLARGETFATVGLSQLTTSRQHTAPAMLARQTEDGFNLRGSAPWVTGAEKADFFVSGAALDDGRQILFVLPRRLLGVSVMPPLELMALQGSLTAELHCDNAFVERKWLLAGPVEKVLATGRGGAGGLETSCLAIGLASAAIDYIKREAGSRPELHATADRLETVQRDLRKQLFSLAEGSSTPDAAVTLRSRANSLVVRSTQAALTASKGTGFIRNHPAQRWARQAMFFLVWSCPRPAADAMLASLACVDE